jgi:putative pyruvate formate lyase activating enzyme
MRRAQTRLRITEEGWLEVVDPGFDAVELLRTIDPDFRIRRARLPGLATPRVLRLRAIPSGFAAAQLSDAPVETLWEAHAAAMARWRTGAACGTGRSHRSLMPAKNGVASAPHVPESASLLDLKIELARRILAACTLCAHRCGVNRLSGQQGICRLTIEGVVAEHFVHIAEEAPINPSLVLNLAGCGLRCRFCQQSALLTPSRVDGEVLDASLWDRLDAAGARSLSFVGGNPSESLYAILKFLSAMPPACRFPVVWNCHAYETPETVELLEGVVDVYVPDYKYGDERCSRRLSGAPGYPNAAFTAIQTMLAQGVPVIVRILVLPEHADCCHRPALDRLAALSRDRLFVSVRGQYCPDWKITAKDGPLARRTTAAETGAIREYARKQGLRLIS